jgi:hypothetical protein
MSKRLHVLLPDEEMAETRTMAQSNGMTVGEWVRSALRAALDRQSARARDAKMTAVQRAAQHALAACEIERNT